ncbi:DUF1499 domain-containing protein [Aureimonas sp. SA4125]|uniref:DUF1499 domain-containing protein n=1 Tax=Aureimonas sp. SA4125 TaxID=2826993 RepID=UPI001CC7BDCF|nr:DUF1499 domain-containing protein [Aureimonas sp. SA4125]
MRTAVPARRAASFAGLLLIVAIALYRLGGIDFPSLKLMFALVVALVSVALLTALVGLARVWHSGREGGGAAVGALAISLLVAAPFALAAVLAYQYPRTNSAETDGMLVNDIVDGATLNEVLAADADPDADAGDGLAAPTGRRFRASAAQVYDVARLVLGDEGWTLVNVVTDTADSAAANVADAGPENGDLGTSGTVDIPMPTPRGTPAEAAEPADRFDLPEAKDYALAVEARDFLLGLPSDMTIRIVEDGNETFVDLRSTSRAVAWDLGQNRRFIDDFLARLDEAMTGVTAIAPAKPG